MSIKKNIRKILVYTLWTVLSAGVMVLLVAAMNIKGHKACKHVEIRINGVESFYFLDKKDVSRMIDDAGIDAPVGRPVEAFNLSGLEALLEKNVWVKDAELFFDNNQVLHTHIIEREPVARLFTTSGRSFYIDSSGFSMPLSEKMSVRVPVFTGFPNYKTTLNSNDSLLMEDIKKISRYIFKDKFWMAQIAQIDITPGRTFSMVPTIGNHVIEFGSGEGYEAKFRRLFVFYKQVLSKTGFDKYSSIDVQYDRQVVATRKGPVPKIDSLKALENIELMIRETMKITEDSVFTPEESYSAWKQQDDSAIILTDSVNRPEGKHLYMPDGNISTIKVKEKSVKPAAVKALVVRSGVAAPVKTRLKKAAPVKPPEQHKPKAVMQKVKG